ncbi:MAG: PAAR domain-containing protein [Aeromonas sp.]
MCSGHDGFPPRKAVEGDASFLINGVPAHADGMVWGFHTKPNSSPHSGVGIGGGSFFINGKPACVIGSAISCGSVIVSGDESFNV